jgi:hypothetical protein
MTAEQIKAKEAQLDTKFDKWQHFEYSDEELKQIAMDIYNNKIFTNRHLHDHEQHMVMSVFMPMLWILSKDRGGSAEERNSKIDSVLVDATREKYFADLGKSEDEVHDAYVKDIGLMFEYNDKAFWYQRMSYIRIGAIPDD